MTAFLLAWPAAGLPVSGGAAEAWPARPVRLIVPFTPGGGTDLVSRALAQRLGEAWKQQVVVDNRGGGGTVLATEIAASARADGHTLLMATTTLAINPSLRRRLPYDTLRQLAPVTQAAAQAYLLVVQPALPVRSVRDLLALARAKPGQLNFGSPGTGSGGQLSVELLKLMTKTDMTHVPYKGGAAALTDLLAGQIQFMFPTILPGLPHVKSGKLVALAVSTGRRSPVLPDLPTVAESGVPGFEAMSWMGLVVPAGTPAAVVARIHRDVAGLLHLAEVRDRIAADGAEPVGSTPEAFGAFIRAEIDKWARVVRAAGIEPD